MKRSSQVQLTLAAGALALVTACAGRDEPRQQVRCYQNPPKPEECVQERRSGYLPLYYPIFFHGRYFNQYGRQAATPPIGSPQYQAAASRAVGTTFTANGPVARGGFGSTGAGRGAVG